MLQQVDRAHELHHKDNILDLVDIICIAALALHVGHEKVEIAKEVLVNLALCRHSESVHSRARHIVRTWLHACPIDRGR